MAARDDNGDLEGGGRHEPLAAMTMAAQQATTSPVARRVLGAGDRITVGVPDLAGGVGPGVFTGATPCLT
jgi:hypothetical protein